MPRPSDILGLVCIYVLVLPGCASDDDPLAESVPIDASTRKSGSTSSPSRPVPRARDAGASRPNDAGRAPLRPTRSRGDDAGPDQDTDDRDAAISDAASAECDPASPFIDILPAAMLFGDARSVEGLELTDIRLSGDELQAFVTARKIDSEDCCDYDLYSAQRSSRSEPFGTLRPLFATTDDIESEPSVSGDGLQLYFARLDPQFKPSLWHAVRAESSEPFGEPVQISGWWSGEKYPRESPVVSASGRALFFSSFVTGNGDLRRADLRRGELGPDTKLAAVNSLGVDFAPVMSAQETILYFASDRPMDSQGEFDLWVAARAHERATFGEPRPVRELNTPASELPEWLSADACRLIFSRKSESGALEILVAERRP